VNRPVGEGRLVPALCRVVVSLPEAVSFSSGAGLAAMIRIRFPPGSTYSGNGTINGSCTVL
jgi:hypothetical protein